MTLVFDLSSGGAPTLTPSPLGAVIRPRVPKFDLDLQAVGPGDVIDLLSSYNDARIIHTNNLLHNERSGHDVDQTPRAEVHEQDYEVSPLSDSREPKMDCGLDSESGVHTQLCSLAGDNFQQNDDTVSNCVASNAEKNIHSSDHKEKDNCNNNVVPRGFATATRVGFSGNEEERDNHLLGFETHFLKGEGTETFYGSTKLQEQSEGSVESLEALHASDVCKETSFKPFEVKIETVNNATCGCPFKDTSNPLIKQNNSSTNSLNKQLDKTFVSAGNDNDKFNCIEQTENSAVICVSDYQLTNEKPPKADKIKKESEKQSFTESTTQPIDVKPKIENPPQDTNSNFEDNYTSFRYVTRFFPASLYPITLHFNFPTKV